MKTRFIRNNKGQVAIFIALMFQLLFLFFAMIVNVGLLVHHKINLQNSVDIAAYYGAMKQAEVLNAIAHVNYQIRQSWKLLVWRQKVLGTAGIDLQDVRFPAAKLRTLGPNSLNENWGGNPATNAANDPTTPFRLVNFCITYAPHEVAGQSNAAENSCKNMYRATNVNLPTATVLSIPGFFTFGNQVANAIRTAAQQAFNRCSAVGALNFMVGGTFIASHYQESLERAHLINHLATSLSQQQDDFFDLSGDRISDGLQKTLQKNLTAANNADVDIEIFNSMGADGCKQPVEVEQGTSTPSWLLPISTYPIWRYVDCISNDQVDAGNIQTTSKQLVDSAATLPSGYINGTADANIIAAINDLRQVLQFRRTIVGFEKDPWCVPYVGVRARARPRIPFMPLSGVEIRAKSFAKPFGGRIGPWYVRDWPQAQVGQGRLAYKANGTQFQQDRLEAIGSIRVSNITGINGIDDPAWAPNIARFVGDTVGFGSERLAAFFHRAILSPVVPDFGPIYENLNAGASAVVPIAPDNRPSLRYYQDVATTFTPNGPNDSLVWDRGANAAPKLRLLELAAIAPNLFDLAYYSIDPDFFNNYYLQLEQAIRKPGTSWPSNRVLLGDLGWRGGSDNANPSKRFNIMNQVAVQNALAGTQVLNTDFSMPYANRNPAHLLNSWVVDSITDYSQNDQKFGKCLSPNSGADNNTGASPFLNPLSPATPGNCVNGGRVGYSVKLVSSEWLRANDLELGGQGQTGAIRNPPPAGW